MFGSRFFPFHYFAERYWPKGTDEGGDPSSVTLIARYEPTITLPAFYRPTITLQARTF